MISRRTTMPEPAPEARKEAQNEPRIAEVKSQQPSAEAVSVRDLTVQSSSPADYRAVVEISPQAVWIADSSGRNIYSNRYWTELTGLTAEQSAGEGWSAAVHPEDLKRLLERWHAALATRTPFEEEARFRDRNGHHRWHLIRSVPLADSRDQVTNWMGIAVDIHDRKVAVHAIAHATERTTLAVEAAEIGTWDYYPETKSVQGSPRCLEMFSNSPREPNMERFLSRVHHDDRGRVTEALRLALDPKIAQPYDIEYRITRSEGDVRWVYAKGKAFFKGDGADRKAVRFSGMILDITERRQRGAQAPKMSKPAEPPSENRDSSSPTGTILLVEDETGLRNILAAYLRERGYKVLEAADAEQATTIADRNPIDILLTDVVMPGMSGAMLASKLPLKQPEMKVIFMSGYVNHPELKVVMRRKSAVLLQKPFRLADLLPIIERALAARRAAGGRNA
jgi:PAS domain S-box-containing protein